MTKFLTAAIVLLLPQSICLAAQDETLQSPKSAVVDTLSSLYEVYAPRPFVTAGAKEALLRPLSSMYLEDEADSSFSFVLPAKEVRMLQDFRYSVSLRSYVPTDAFLEDFATKVREAIDAYLVRAIQFGRREAASATTAHPLPSPKESPADHVLIPSLTSPLGDAPKTHDTDKVIQTFHGS